MDICEPAAPAITNMLKLKHNQSPDCENTCICNIINKTNSLMIKCSNTFCQNPWWHSACAGLPDVSNAVMKKVTWNCPLCTINNFWDSLALSNPDTELLTNHLKEEIKKEINACIPKITEAIIEQVQPTTSTYNTLKKDMTLSFAEIMKEQKQESPGSITKDIIKEAINEDKMEQRKIEERKRNIMIFNVPEPETGNTEKDAAADYDLFKKAYHFIDKTILENENEVIQIKRLGQKQQKVRPIMVTVQSEKAKKKLFSQLHKLKNVDEFKHIKP